MFEKQPQCRLSAHVALWKVSLRLVLQTISRGRYIFASSNSCCQVFFVSYFSFLSRFAVLCTMGSQESCLWLMNKVAFVHEKETLWVVSGSRMLQEAKIDYWLIWWSQTQGPSISLWFSLTFLGTPTGWSIFPHHAFICRPPKTIWLGFFQLAFPYLSGPMLFQPMWTATSPLSSTQIRAGSSSLGSNTARTTRIEGWKPHSPKASTAWHRFWHECHRSVA